MMEGNMDVNAILEIIGTLGFPIFCVLALGAFIFVIYRNMNQDNKENMEKVQARCKEREEKLYQQLDKQNEINGRFAEIIAQYEVKLDEINNNVKEIKNDVLLIKAKTE